MPNLQIQEAQSIPGSKREGNGNPLQCSCLENPRDRGAWWAAIYGISQSQTWLKQLSSSSSSKREKKPTSFIIKYKISKSARGKKKIPLGRGPDGFIRELILSNTQRTCMHACILSPFSRVWLSRCLCPWDSADKTTGVGCHTVLQEIFPTQGSNPCLLCLLHWQAGFFFTTGTSWEAWVILEWVTMPSSRGLNPHFLVSCIGKQVLDHKEQLLLYFLKLLPRIEIEETLSPTHFMTPTTLLRSLTRTLKERKVTDSTSS